jgi:hypothetical protein
VVNVTDPCGRILGFLDRIIIIIIIIIIIYRPTVARSRNETTEFITRIITLPLGSSIIVIGWGTLLQAGMSRVRIPMRPEVFVYPHYSPALDSVSKRNEHQESFLGGGGLIANSA